MPIQMEDIHTPTVVAAPAAVSGRTTRNGDPSTGELLALMEQRDRVEAELKALGAVLDSVRTTQTVLFTPAGGQTTKRGEKKRKNPAKKEKIRDGKKK